MCPSHPHHCSLRVQICDSHRLMPRHSPTGARIASLLSHATRFHGKGLQIVASVQLKNDQRQRSIVAICEIGLMASYISHDNQTCYLLALKLSGNGMFYV